MCACSVVSNSLPPHGLQHSWLLCSWAFPGRNTGMGCHFLLQRVFLTQGLNWHFQGLLHCRWILSHCHLGIPLTWIYFCFNKLLLLLLLSLFRRVRLCATPYTAAHQAPPSLGFSRQEHWSGLPFPSPMLESEKWKWSHSVVSDSSRPHELQPTRLLHPWVALNYICKKNWFRSFQKEKFLWLCSFSNHTLTITQRLSQCFPYPESPGRPICCFLPGSSKEVISLLFYPLG